MNKKLLKTTNTKVNKIKWLYYILQIIIVLYTIFHTIKGNVSNMFQCFLVFGVSFMPIFIEKKFSLSISEFLKFIMLLFIFNAIILGGVKNFYNLIPLWDIFLHTLSGFLWAGIGFAIINFLNKNRQDFKIVPFFLIISLCFSMTISTSWEFFEFASDNITESDMQKDKYINRLSSTLLNGKLSKKPFKTKEITYTILYDKNNKEIIYLDDGYLDIGLFDTMEDLMVNFLGALFFGIISYNKLQNKNHYYRFIENFTIKKIAKHYT